MIHLLMNHLWQSTLFAVAAGLLTLALRKNGAHTRYWLWCAASWKFLIPFSALSTVGSYLSWRSTPAAPVPLKLEQFAQPFSTPAVSVPVVAMVPAHSPGINLLAIWISVWACGAVAVGIYWMVRWLRIRAAVKDATALALDAPIEVRSSWTLIEPGVVGLFRPVLLLPDGICERLTSEQLQTILTHELSHVRRRDNLTASIHMLVEALFWFHPLVWWIGRRSIMEREGACDDAVIAAGGDREEYAEALLTVCKFYVQSPLASAAGVAGAHLQRRIELIMNPRIVQKLSAARKALLATSATAAILVPIAIGSLLAIPYRTAGQTAETKGATFQSVSVRQSQPGGLGHTILVGADSFRVQNYSLRELIAWAFDVQGALVLGPDTLAAKFDVEAKAPRAFPVGGEGTVEAARAMVRNLLAEQFELETHRGTQTVSAYILTASGGGTHFQVAQPGKPWPLLLVGPTSIGGNKLRMNDLVVLLSQQLGGPVIDRTGLTQTYDFNLNWIADSSPVAHADTLPTFPPNPSADVLASALQTQVGMTIQLEQALAEVLVVDRLQSPKDLVAARQAAPMDPKLFDSYVGHYAMPGGMVMTVSRDNEHFFTQLPGQPPVEVFSEGHGNFFANVVNAQISFESDARGQVSELVLHQNGRDVSAPRLDEATAEQMADALTAKIQQQIAAPGSEQALRRFNFELATGKPDYDRMSPGLAQATREQLPGLQPWLASLGSLVSLKFTGVDPRGADTYKAEFERGSAEWHISMAPDGKIASALVLPAP